MYDERMAYLDQQRSEQHAAERRASRSDTPGGMVDLALLPFSAVIGVLCGTLRLVLEKRQERSEAKRLEALILDASQRADTGKIIPLEALLEMERGSNYVRRD